MKKMIVAIMVLVAMLSAAIVQVDKAKTVAENYYQNYAPSSAKSNTVVKTLTKEYLGQPTWYVFQFTQGFVIVAAEDNVRPILGYSFTSPIDEDLYNMNNPFVAKFSFYDKQIVHDIREKNLVVEAKQKEWKDIENKVFPSTKALETAGPLLETTWSQGYPFDELLPANCPVGCVATAMHQILRFYQGPETGAGSNTYTDNVGTTTGTHSVNFSTQTYDWSLMQTLNGIGVTQAEVDECSKMAYHLGVSVDMDYETDGSGATMPDALSAFQNNWGSPTAYYQFVGTIVDTTSTWSSTIMTEIDNDRPIEWAGSDATYGGHAFVLDGYRVDLINGIYSYHFNWGWGGSYNGYFYLADLSPGVPNFATNQSFIRGIFVDGLLAQMPPPATCNAAVNYAGDVTITWTVPGTVTPMGTLVDYIVYRDNVAIKTMGGIGTRTYIDPSRPQGTDTYFVKAVYESPDGNSLASPSSAVTVVPDPSYPVPVGLSAIGMTDVVNQYNRTSVDLAWAKPFVGVTYVYDGFEGNTVDYPSGINPTGWVGKTATAFPPTSWTSNPIWQAIGPGYSTDYKIQGDWCMGTIPGTAAYQMTFWGTRLSLTGNPNAKMTFWPFAWAGSTLKVVLFAGTDLANSPSGQITQVWTKTFAADSHLESQVVVDLSAYTGNYFIGIVGDMANGSFFTVDEVLCGYDTWISAGNPSGQPTNYEIYRNNALLTTVAATSIDGETYADTAYDDGYNEYYVRAVYGANSSIASNPNSAWMDMAPVPLFLDGTYNESQNESDLTWYAPGHYPAHWFGWEYESDDAWYLNYTDDGATVDICRTKFNAMDFGMGYPVYVSDITCAFWEEVGDEWESDQFRFAIGYGTDDDNPTYLHTSAVLTAVGDGSFYDYALPQTYEINQDWFVEVQFIDLNSANPSPMMLVHEEGNGIPFNTTWHFDDGTDVGWYAWGYNAPYDTEDMMIYCYGWNDEPTYSKESTPERPVYTGTELNSKKVFGSKAVLNTLPSPPQKGQILADSDATKGLSTYQVWRNDARLATTTNTFYTDPSPIGGNNVYYITAMYTNPTSESVASNEITLGPPPAATFPAAIAATQAPTTSGTDAFTLGNTGNGALNYDLTFAYTDVMSQLIEPAGAAADFATALSPYVNAGTGIVWTQRTNTSNLDGTPHAYIVAPSTNIGTTATLTSPTFDGTGCEYLEFDHVSSVTNASSLLKVEYSVNGGTNYTQLYIAQATTVGAWGAPDHQQIALPSTSTTMRIRFTATLIRRSNNYVGLDNVSVNGFETLIDPWFSFVSPVSGTVDATSTSDITCGYDATTLPIGEYHGNVTVTSNDVTNPTKVIPVILTVTNAIGLTAPENVVTTINGSNVEITWDPVSGASGYNVYISADPYGTFALAPGGNVSTEAYTAAYTTKFFYYIKATDAKTVAPKTINVVKPKMTR